MYKRPKETEDVEGLEKVISIERARVRWRIEVAEDDEPPKRPERNKGKLARIFKDCLGE